MLALRKLQILVLWMRWYQAKERGTLGTDLETMGWGLGSGAQAELGKALMTQRRH
jgi:hypothetical protein